MWFRRRDMGFDVVAEVRHIDELIDRVDRALREAEGHGNVILVDINKTKKRELEELRAVLVPEPRQPDE